MSSISFIMPTYNRSAFIEQSINSILPQMREDDELIVVNDGSTDKTQQVLEKFYKQIVYIHQSNSGKSAALNNGIEESRNDYIWICDDDDLLRPGSVTKLRNALDGTQYDMVFGCYTRFSCSKNKKKDLGTGYWPDLSSGSLRRHILEDAFIMHNASLVRKKVYQELNGFDESYLRSQDYEMFVRIALRYNIKYLDEIIFDQRKHDGLRGPKAVSHNPQGSDVVWQKFDKKIFETLRDQVPISFYEALFKSKNKSLRKRAAHLQRACILGRHGLWKDSIEGFELASKILPYTSITNLERSICVRSVLGKHGLFNINDESIVSSFRDLSKTSKVGRQIVSYMMDGMLWGLRGEDLHRRVHTRRFLLRMFKPSILAFLLQKRLFPVTSEIPQVYENPYLDKST